MKRDVTATEERNKVHFSCYFSFFFFGKGTRQASHLRTDKDLLWDTEKKITFLSVTGENVFFLGNGKGISQGEGRRLLLPHRPDLPDPWCRAASYPWDRPSPSRLGLA